VNDLREFRATCVAGHETVVIGHRIGTGESYIFGSAADFCGVCDEPIEADLVPL
jgi:hypothetical protein